MAAVRLALGEGVGLENVMAVRGSASGPARWARISARITSCELSPLVQASAMTMMGFVGYRTSLAKCNTAPFHP